MAGPPGFEPTTTGLRRPELYKEGYVSSWVKCNISVCMIINFVP